MAIKTLQKLAMRSAVKGVRVTGLDCNGAMPADGILRFLSLLWQAQPGPFPAERPDVSLAEDNARMAQAVLRTGRSAAFAGVILPTPSSHASYRPLSRSVKRMRMVQG
jgi:hypothetical protein